MVFDKVIEGRYVDLRSATEDDAEFTLAIRQDPEIYKYLTFVGNTIEQQTEWINQQRQKDGDYFFVVWDKEGQRIGTNGIYDINGDHAEAGRLAIRGNAFQSIEAQLLSLHFAFNDLNFSEVVSFIYEDNQRALRFSQLFNGVVCDLPVNKNNHIARKVIYRKEDFDICNRKIKAMLYR